MTGRQQRITNGLIKTNLFFIDTFYVTILIALKTCFIIGEGTNSINFLSGLNNLKLKRKVVRVKDFSNIFKDFTI